MAEDRESLASAFRSGEATSENLIGLFRTETDALQALRALDGPWVGDSPDDEEVYRALVAEHVVFVTEARGVAAYFVD